MKNRTYVLVTTLLLILSGIFVIFIGEAMSKEYPIAQEDSLAETEFIVEIVEYDEEVVEGEDLDVVADITNEGEEEATQTIELYDADEPEPILDDQDVTLDGGASETVTLTWQTDVPGSYNLNVSSEDDEDQINIDVLEQAGFIVEIDEEASDIEVVEGEDLDVIANITNVGEEETTQTIELYNVDEDDTILDEYDITLGEDEFEHVTLTWETEVNEADEYYIEVRSENDKAAMEVTVLKQAFFDVTIDEDPSDVEVLEGEEMDVYADIENTGGQMDTQDIKLYDEEDNELDSYTDLTLGPDDDYTILLTWDTEDYDAGEYTLRVASDDHEEEIEVTLIKATEFTVEIDREESDTEGVEGEDFVIVADIENIGEEDEMETQTIELYDEEGTVLDDQEVSLGPGGSERIELTWETEFGDAGGDVQDFQLRVVSEDDDDRIIVELNPAPNLNFVSETWYIDGDEMDPEEGFELEEGDTLAFEVQIRNEGGAPIYNALFEYDFPDGAEGSENIDVEADEIVSVSAEWNVRIVDDPEIYIWVDSPEYERTHDEIRYFENDFEDIEPTEIRFEDLNFPDYEMIPGDSYHFSGRVVRDDDDKPLENIDVTISLRSSLELVGDTVSTDENGEFGVFIQIPEGADGEYTVEFEAHTHEVQSTQQSVEVETDVLEIAGIPWWLLLIIVAIVTGGAGSAVVYFKLLRAGEMIECENCGETISADATTCPSCGVELDIDRVRCSECGEVIPRDSELCPNCDQELEQLMVEAFKEEEEKRERLKELRETVNEKEESIKSSLEKINNLLSEFEIEPEKLLYIIENVRERFREISYDENKIESMGYSIDEYEEMNSQLIEIKENLEKAKKLENEIESLTEEEPNIDTREVEKSIKENDLDRADEALERLKEKHSEYKEIIKELRSLDERKSSLAAQLADEKIDRDTYNDAVQNIEYKKAELEEKLNRLREEVLYEDYEKPF